MCPGPPGAMGAARGARRGARGGRCPLYLPAHDGPGPTARACASDTRVPAHRDVRGPAARMARDGAVRPPGPADDPTHRLPHDRAPDLLTRTDHFLPRS